MAFLDETGLAELWSLIQAEYAERAQIATGSYTGTGTYGSSNPNSLTFDFVPRFIVLYTCGTGSGNSTSDFNPLFMIYGGNGVNMNSSNPPNYSTVVVTWAENTASWYGTDVSQQKNVSSRVYYYIAIG